MTDAAALIREMLARAGLSQSEMARRLGVTQNVVNRWATGAVVPNATAFLCIVGACGFELRAKRRQTSRA